MIKTRIKDPAGNLTRYLVFIFDCNMNLAWITDNSIYRDCECSECCPNAVEYTIELRKITHKHVSIVSVYLDFVDLLVDWINTEAVII